MTHICEFGCPLPSHLPLQEAIREEPRGQEGHAVELLAGEELHRVKVVLPNKDDFPNKKGNKILEKKCLFLRGRAGGA